MGMGEASWSKDRAPDGAAAGAGIFLTQTQQHHYQIKSASIGGLELILIYI